MLLGLMLISWKVSMYTQMLGQRRRDGDSDDSYKQVDTDDNGDRIEDDQETEKI